MANSYLNHSTSSSTGKIFTLSWWMKKSLDTSNGTIFNMTSDSNTHNYIEIATKNTTGLDVQLKNGSSGTFLRRRLNRMFKDFSAWYHCVIRFDSTQSTASDRFRIYVNGELATDIDTDSTPDAPLNYVTEFNNSSSLDIGRNAGNGSNFFDGSMSHMVLTDGYSYGPTSFGLADSTTGQWKFKPPSGISYGTNGFHLKFENSGALGTDSSGQSNTFSVNGNLKQGVDTPTNGYCTLNPLAVGSSPPTFSKGANRVVGTATSYQFSCGTLEVPLNGKWYWEVKANNNINGSTSEYLIGAVLESRLQASNNFAEFAADGITQYGSVSPNIGQNDIISVAVDRTAATLKIYKNNSLIVTKSSLPAEIIFPMVTVFGSGTGADANFGNGYFGGSAISSAGSNGNGSLFEYDVPSGFYALNTKNINTYG